MSRARILADYVSSGDELADKAPLASPAFTGTASFSDGNITNVGNIALDTISSDAGTSIGVTLGTDAGDDFNVGSGKLVVEGDTGNVGIGTSSPGYTLEVKSPNATASTRVFQVTDNGGNYNFYIREDSGIYVDTMDPATGTTVVRNANGHLYLDSSSKRYKENITAISIGLDFVKKLRPVDYDLIKGKTKH